RTLRRREPEAPLFAIGVSLGGNVLLKWLGERGAGAPVDAAAAVSTPYDLGASAGHLDTFVGRVYVGSFLATLRGKAVAAARRFPSNSSHRLTGDTSDGSRGRRRGARAIGRREPWSTLLPGPAADTTTRSRQEIRDLLTARVAAEVARTVVAALTLRTAAPIV